MNAKGDLLLNCLGGGLASIKFMMIKQFEFSMISILLTSVLKITVSLRRTALNCLL
jgi:hypothetical protein